MYAPIVLFVYNRPRHTLQTLESLYANDLADQSVLYIYSDGPKNNASPETIKNIQSVREIIRQRNWCKEVITIESEKNKGLADSIIEGVTEIVNLYGKIIVLEDDLLLSKGFLKYMNDALNLYKDVEKIMEISGYMFPIKNNLPETFFFRSPSSWGWATWKRSWDKLITDSDYLLDYLVNENLVKFFTIENSHMDFFKQLKQNSEKRLYTWAIKFNASIIINGGLCLYPRTSLVQNIGFDNSGENCRINDKYFCHEILDEITVNPIEIKESKDFLKLMIEFNRLSLSDSIKMIIPTPIKNIIKKVIKK